MPSIGRKQVPSGKGKEKAGEKDETMSDYTAVQSSSGIISDIDSAIANTEYILTTQQKRDCGCGSLSEYSDWMRGKK